jgi:hypothetical protein
MATPLSLGILENFSVIFIFIFIWAVLFGIFEIINIFGDGKRNLNAIVAFVVALIAAITPDFVFIIKTILPWTSLMIVFFFFLFAIPLFMGLGKDDVLTFLGGKKKIAVVGWVLGAMIFLILYSLSQIHGDELLNYGDTGEFIEAENGTATGFQENLFKTVFNPQIIGLFMFMIIAVLAITYLSRVG